MAIVFLYASSFVIIAFVTDHQEMRSSAKSR